MRKMLSASWHLLHLRFAHFSSLSLPRSPPPSLNCQEEGELIHVALAWRCVCVLLYTHRHSLLSEGRTYNIDQLGRWNYIKQKCGGVVGNVTPLWHTPVHGSYTETNPGYSPICTHGDVDTSKSYIKSPLPCQKLFNSLILEYLQYRPPPPTHSLPLTHNGECTPM